MKVMIDIDGVVADYSRRAKFLPDWHKFFEDVENDPPIPIGVELSRLLIFYGMNEVVWATGRYESLHEVTRRWLAKHVYRRHYVRPDILMRADGDNRPSCEMKLDHIVTFRPELVIDDEPSVINVALEQGIAGIVFSASRELSLATACIENLARV